MRGRILEEQFRRGQRLFDATLPVLAGDRHSRETESGTAVLVVDLECSRESIRRGIDVAHRESGFSDSELQIQRFLGLLALLHRLEELPGSIVVVRHHRLLHREPVQGGTHRLEKAHHLSNREGQFLRRLLRRRVFAFCVVIRRVDCGVGILVERDAFLGQFALGIDLRSRQLDAVLVGLGPKTLELLERPLEIGVRVQRESVDREATFLDTTQSTETRDQVEPESSLPRPVAPDLLENLGRLPESPAVHVGLCEVVLELPRGLPDRFVGVLVGFLDVSEFDQLLHRLRALHRVDVRTLGVHAVRMGTVDVVPGGHRLDRSIALEDRHQGLAVHVLADGKTEGGQDGRRQVEHARTTDGLALADFRPLRDEDAVRTMLDRRSGRFDGDVLGPKVIGMESMIGNQDDGGVLAGEVQQRAEHHVVEAVSAFDDPLVDLEVLFLDEGLPRRVVLHEAVTEVIDPVVVDRHEVPGLELHQRRRRTVNGDGVGERLRESGQSLVLLLIDFRELRNEGADVLVIEFERVKAELLEILGEAGRVDGALRHLPLRHLPAGGVRPRLADLGVDVRVLDVPRRLVEVADHHAVDGFGRVRRPPTDHVALLADLVEHVPDRLGRPIGVRDRTDRLSVRSRFTETMNAVLVGSLSRADRGPERRTEDRVERGDVAVHALRHHLLEIRHLAVGDHRMDHAPVGGVPTDHEDLAIIGDEFRGLGHAWIFLFEMLGDDYRIVSCVRRYTTIVDRPVIPNA